jgi:plasmid stabilization system protein ParE
MTFTVRLTKGADADIQRLIDFLVVQDLAAVRRARKAIAEGMKFLRKFPFSCRKADGDMANPFLRELIIPFGGAGYVALFEIEDENSVIVIVVRHQREEDYY